MLQTRKSSVPVYMQGIGVVEQDFLDASTTLADATLEEIKTLSVAAGGSDDLAIIYNHDNVIADFNLSTTMNELHVQPHAPNTDSGITVTNPDAHPCLFFVGTDTHPGGGRGMIQFGSSQTGQHASIFQSTYDDSLNLMCDKAGGIVLNCPKVVLDDTACTLTRGSTEVFTELTSLQTQIDNISPSLASDTVIENTNGNASLTISSTGANGPVSSISLAINDTSVNDEDRIWYIRNDSLNHSELVIQHEWLGVTKTPLRIFSDGRVAFSGATSSSGHGVVFQDTILAKSVLHLWDDIDGTAYNSSANFGTGTVTCGVITLAGIDVEDKLDEIPVPLLERNTVHMNPGNYTVWPILDDVTVFVHDTTQTSRYRLPEFPVDGQQLLILTAVAAGQGTINIHTGAFSGRTFHWKSTGFASSVQCNLNSVGTTKFHCVYISALNQWLLV